MTPAGAVPTPGTVRPDRRAGSEVALPETKTPAPRVLPTLVTVEDAARRLAVSLRTLRSIIAAGHLSVIRVSARRIAIDTADLAEFIERRRRCAGGR